MKRTTTLVLSALALGALSAAPEHADAAGLYFADRGVRPLSRAGAFIAGGDDLGAIAYNPAGVFDAGTQVLLDGSWVDFSSKYTRKALLRDVDPNTGETIATNVKTFDTVNGTTPFLPIPTIAASYKLHPEWVVFGGVWAPYAALASYPDTVGGRPAPQRYSLFSLDGSVLAFVGGGVAYAPSKELRLGATLGALTGTFNARMVFSGCIQERFFCAPEDPDFDIQAQLAAGPIIAPTGQLGALWIPSPRWRIGAAIGLPTFVRSAATVKTRLASAPIFDGASQEGDSATVSFDLPLTARAGVEARVGDDLRVELGVGVEAWSMHGNITVEPDELVLKNVVGFPKEFRVPSVKLPRNFTNSVSVRLGGEYAVHVGPATLDLRTGASYETSAVPPKYLSVLTLDAPKLTVAGGLGLRIGAVRLDATFARVFVSDVSVDPKDAGLLQVSPVQTNPPKEPNYINGGDYSAQANIIGLGLTYTFDSDTKAAPSEPDTSKERPEEAPPDEGPSDVSPE